MEGIFSKNEREKSRVEKKRVGDATPAVKSAPARPGLLKWGRNRNQDIKKMVERLRSGGYCCPTRKREAKKELRLSIGRNQGVKSKCGQVKVGRDPVNLQ